MSKNQNIEIFRETMAVCMPKFIGEEEIQKLDKMNFFEAPASLKYHGAEFGGLFRHSLEVTKQLLKLTEQCRLKWLRPESPYIVGMFHDLCKTDNYKFINASWQWNDNRTLSGHGDKSVIMLQQLILQKLTEEEILCIRWHMGAFDEKDKWDLYGAAIEQYPNVLYTHTADMIAARISKI